jgi:hypothetical protein
MNIYTCIYTPECKGKEPDLDNFVLLAEEGLFTGPTPGVRKHLYM